MLFAGGGGSTGSMTSAIRVIALMRIAAKAVAYAKLKSAVAIVLVVASFAFTTQASVRKYINETLRIPIPSFDVGRWIRPMLQNLLPDLRADATPKPIRADDSIVPIKPLPRPTHLHPLLDAPNVAAAPAAPAPMQPPVREVLPGAIELARTEPQLTDLARAILDPPSLRTGPSAFALSEVIAPSIGDQPGARGADEPSKPADQPLTASAGDLLLGAGGGGGAGGKPEVYVLPAN